MQTESAVNIITIWKRQLRKHEETEGRFPEIQNGACVKQQVFFEEMKACINFISYKLNYKGPLLFSTVHCSACSSWRRWKLFTDNNNIYLWEDALFGVLRAECRAITGEILPYFSAAVNRYYCAFLIFSKDHAAPLRVTEVMNRFLSEWFQHVPKQL